MYTRFLRGMPLYHRTVGVFFIKAFHSVHAIKRCVFFFSSFFQKYNSVSVWIKINILIGNWLHVPSHCSIVWDALELVWWAVQCSALTTRHTHNLSISIVFACMCCCCYRNVFNQTAWAFSIDLTAINEPDFNNYLVGVMLWIFSIIPCDKMECIVPSIIFINLATAVVIQTSQRFMFL